MLNNKKGQEIAGISFWELLGLVLLIAGMVILFLLVPKYTAFGSELSEDTACTNSIAGSYISGEERIAKCPIKEYIAANNALFELKERKKQKSEIVKEFSANTNKVNELFTKLMLKCLQKGGGVNSRAFSRGWTWTSTICLECATVSFDTDVAQSSFQGFRAYLESNTPTNSKNKYIELFARDQDHKDAWIDYGVKNDFLPGKISDSIEKNNIYSVFFIGVKESTLKALAVKWSILDRDDDYFVYAAPQENFNGKCDRKVN